MNKQTYTFKRLAKLLLDREVVIRDTLDDAVSDDINDCDSIEIGDDIVVTFIDSRWKAKLLYQQDNGRDGPPSTESKIIASESRIDNVIRPICLCFKELEINNAMTAIQEEIDDAMRDAPTMEDMVELMKEVANSATSDTIWIDVVHRAQSILERHERAEQICH